MKKEGGELPDEEEKELLASIERGEWQTVENLEEEIEKAKHAAANFLKKLEKS